MAIIIPGIISGTGTTGPVQTLTETVKNTSGGTLLKGTPVRITGATGQEANVGAADASTSFPANFVLAETLAPGESGQAVALGFINNVSVPNASLFTAGQEVWLAVGGGWTTTRPTGTANIQLLGNIVKVNTGTNTISGIFAPQNIEYLPNLAQGKVWVGNAAGVPEEVTLVQGLPNLSQGKVWVGNSAGVPEEATLGLWPMGNAINVANDTTDATNDIQFIADGKAVQCRDTSRNMLWVTPAAGTVIKRADAAWASGTNAGGMGSGLTFTINTEYYLFLITNGNSIDYGFDTSITAANLRAATGWSYYRVVGWNKSTTGPAWRKFRRNGVWHWWRDQWAATSTVGGAVATVSVDAPTGFDCHALFAVGSGHSAAGKSVSFWMGAVSESNPTILERTWLVPTGSMPMAVTTADYNPSQDFRFQRVDLELIVISGQIKTFGWDHFAGTVSSASSWLGSSFYPHYLVRAVSLENLINV